MSTPATPTRPAPRGEAEPRDHPAQRASPTRRVLLRVGLQALGSTGIAALAGCTTSPESVPPGPSDSSSPAPNPSGRNGNRTTPAPRVTRAHIVERYANRHGRAWGLGTAGEITRIDPAGSAVALTFDACGGPGGDGYDAALIGLLRRRDVAATLLLNQRWIDANPGPAAELAADPLFALGNHGRRHVPLSTSGRSAYGIRGTGDVGQIYDEVMGSCDWLAAHRPGEPIFFRSGTAFADDVAIEICREMGMLFVGFTVNGDAGATFRSAQIDTALDATRPGDVVIAHLNRPAGDTAEGFSRALPRLLDQGLVFVRLGDRLRSIDP